jgi:hypothetical protein
MGDAWDHRPEVLRGICHTHHVKRTSAQGNAAMKRLRSLRYRPAEKHPGFKEGTALRTHIGTTAYEEGTVLGPEGTALYEQGG